MESRSSAGATARPSHEAPRVVIARVATYSSGREPVGLLASPSDDSVESRAAAEQQALHDRYQEVLAERQHLAEEANRLIVLEQVDRQRAALLRSVSHDLRTPLATIKAVTSDLRGGAAYDPSRATDCSTWSATRRSGSTASWPTSSA